MNVCSRITEFSIELSTQQAHKETLPNSKMIYIPAPNAVVAGGAATSFMLKSARPLTASILGWKSRTWKTIKIVVEGYCMLYPDLGNVGEQFDAEHDWCPQNISTS